MRTVLTIVSVALLAVLGPGAAAAQGESVEGSKVGGFYIGAGLMEAWGDGGFRISGVDADLGRFTSQLELPMDGTYFVLETGIDDIGRGFGVHLRYGSSGNLDGTAVDVDHAWDLSSEEFVKSFSASDGESMFLTVDVSWCISGGPRGGPSGGRLDIFGGYHMQDTTFEVTNVHTVIAYATPVNVVTAGTAATYDMEFYGVRVGIRGEMPVGRSSTISGHLAVLPFVAADGFGQWVLREKVFDHDATGWGIDALIRYEFAVSDSLRLWAGAGFTRLEGTNGTDDQFRFSGESLGRASLDELKSESRFVMIGGEFRF